MAEPLGDDGWEDFESGRSQRTAKQMQGPSVTITSLGNFEVNRGMKESLGERARISLNRKTGEIALLRAHQTDGSYLLTRTPAKKWEAYSIRGDSFWKWLGMEITRVQGTYDARWDAQREAFVFAPSDPVRTELRAG